MDARKETRYLPLWQIIGDGTVDPPIPAIVPVSKTTWWKGVREGRYPQPIRSLEKRITVWREDDIEAFINGR